MKRDVYSKLMKLQSSGADALLEDKFKEIDKTIRAAKDNDTIYEQLESLEQFIYKVNEKVIELLGYIFKMKPLDPITHHTQFGDVEGKDYGDLLTKSLELTNRIRYYQTPKILEIYFKLYKKGAEKRLEDRLRDLARYDLEALKHIGYRTQNDVIAFLRKKKSDKIYIEFMSKVLEHMATSEGEHHGMQSENTITFGFAPLPVNDDLRNIRSWIIEELSRLLLDNNVSITHKQKIIDLLQSMTHGPHRGEPSKELTELIDENSLTVLGVYKNLLLGNDGISAPLPLALDIEEKLYYMGKGRTEEIKEAISSLLSSIRQDKSYEIYIALVGDRLEYRTTEGSFDEKRNRAQERRDKLINGFSMDSTLLLRVIDHIAQYSDDIEDWKLNTFNYFIEDLAKRKPQPAFKLLKGSFEADKPLIKFVGYFLTGFKKANATNEYVSTLEYIITNKMIIALPNVALSLKDSEWSEDDINIATELLNKSGRFDFIVKNEWPNYLYALTTSLVCNLDKEPPKVTELFIELINKYKKYSKVYFGAIDMATHRDSLDLEKFDENVKSALLDKLIPVDRLEHDYQDLLYELTEKNPSKILEFFISRVRFVEKNPKVRDGLSYDAIPYHLNDNIRDVFKNDSRYSETFKNIVDGFTVKWSYYNSEMAQLFKSVGNYKKPLLEYIDTANKVDLRKALDFFAVSVDSMDLDIAFAIAAKTDDKKIWSSIRTNLYSTGVVSGEYGLANAHQAQYDAIEQKYSKSKDERVRRFAQETMSWLKDVIKNEIQRTEEDLRLRKIDFEH